MSLFDQQDLAEITSPEFPGERLIACRNPALAEERARKREALLAATEKLLAPVIARVTAGRLTGEAEIGRKAGEVIGRYKMAKHLHVAITGTSLAIERKHDQIAEEARLDGIYVIRTPLPAAELDAAGTVTAYKNLKYVERDFRHRVTSWLRSPGSARGLTSAAARSRPTPAGRATAWVSRSPCRGSPCRRRRRPRRRC